MFLALISIFRSIINESHLCESRPRKKVLENFRKFISQERRIRIWSNAINVSILKDR